MGEDFSRLKRPKEAMPGFVKRALQNRELLAAYRKRPAYQQNDYLRWINEAKLKETKMKRLNQMLDELEKGGIYMDMDHPASGKSE